MWRFEEIQTCKIRSCSSKLQRKNSLEKASRRWTKMWLLRSYEICKLLKILAKTAFFDIPDSYLELFSCRERLRPRRCMLRVNQLQNQLGDIASWRFVHLKCALILNTRSSRLVAQPSLFKSAQSYLPAIIAHWTSHGSFKLGMCRSVLNWKIAKLLIIIPAIIPCWNESRVTISKVPNGNGQMHKIMMPLYYLKLPDIATFNKTYLKYKNI